MMAVWLCETRSHGRRKAATHPAAGAGATAPTAQFCRTPSIGVSCFLPVWARSIFSSSCVVVRWPARVQAPLAGGTGARVQGRSRRPQESLCLWLAGPCASPPSGGHGRPCARPLKAATQAGTAWAVVARCVRGTTSSRSASAACGVRGVRAAQQRGSRQSYQSKRNASSIMLS